MRYLSGSLDYQGFDLNFAVVVLPLVKELSMEKNSENISSFSIYLNGMYHHFATISDYLHEK